MARFNVVTSEESRLEKQMDESENTRNDDTQAEGDRAHAPMTEAEIRASHVGPLKPLTQRIEIADYDPDWPRLFEREAQRVRRVLGNHVLLLEHVGSTSVPGLAAKPRIDMLLVVKDSSDEVAYLPALETAGYRLVIREPEWYQHRVFKGPDTDVNVHVFSSGCLEIERMLSFRDWLRTHDDERELYESTKRELAAKDWKYTQNYADAKTEVVEAIILRAKHDRERKIRQAGTKRNRD